jgi:hypothetical protein
MLQWYCTYGRQEITDVHTLSFRWIKPFWYFWLKTGYKASLALYPVFKQKYQKGFIHRKLRVRTSEREGKLSNPRGRAARAMHEFFFSKIYEFPRTNAARARCGDFLPPIGTVQQRALLSCTYGMVLFWLEPLSLGWNGQAILPPTPRRFGNHEK